MPTMTQDNPRLPKSRGAVRAGCDIVVWTEYHGSRDETRISLPE
jgi:hypothetical protein